VQGWLTDRRWEDEDILTGSAFAKKYNKKGRFLRYENGMYYFEEKEAFGIFIAQYDRKGKFISDGKERKTEEKTGV